MIVIIIIVIQTGIDGPIVFNLTQAMQVFGEKKISMDFSTQFCIFKDMFY